MGWEVSLAGKARVAEVRLGWLGEAEQQGGHTWGGWSAGRHTELRRGGEGSRGQGNWEGEGRRSFQDNLRLKDRLDSGISTG